MKKNKIIFIITTILIIVLNLATYVKADSKGNSILELTSNKKKINKNEEFEIIISTKQPIDISVLTGKITFDSNNIEFVDESNIFIEKNNKLLAFDINYQTSYFSSIISQEIGSKEILCKLKLKAKKKLSLKSDSIKLEDLKLVDKSYETKSQTTVKLNFNQENQQTNTMPPLIIPISIFVILLAIILIKIKQKK